MGIVIYHLYTFREPSIYVMVAIILTYTRITSNQTKTEKLREILIRQKLFDFGTNWILACYIVTYDTCLDIFIWGPFQIKSHLHLHNMTLNAYFLPPLYILLYFYWDISSQSCRKIIVFCLYLFEGLIFFLSDALFLSTFDLPWFIPAYKTTLQLPIITLFD